MCHRGQFTLNQKFGVTLSGTSGARIVVKGAGASETTITQQADQNVMDVAGTYFSFYNMTFTGGSRGVRLFGTASAVNIALASQLRTLIIPPG